MHTAIMQLVQLCPKLRELDHYDFYEKRFAWRRIAIIREGEFGERVMYEVKKSPAKWVLNLVTPFSITKMLTFVSSIGVSSMSPMGHSINYGI